MGDLGLTPASPGSRAGSFSCGEMTVSGREQPPPTTAATLTAPPAQPHLPPEHPSSRVRLQPRLVRGQLTNLQVIKPSFCCEQLAFPECCPHSLSRGALLGGGGFSERHTQAAPQPRPGHSSMWHVEALHQPRELSAGTGRDRSSASCPLPSFSLGSL